MMSASTTKALIALFLLCFDASNLQQPGKLWNTSEEIRMKNHLTSRANYTGVFYDKEFGYMMHQLEFSGDDSVLYTQKDEYGMKLSCKYKNDPEGLIKKFFHEPRQRIDKLICHTEFIDARYESSRIIGEHKEKPLMLVKAADTEKSQFFLIENNKVVEQKDLEINGKEPVSLKYFSDNFKLYRAKDRNLYLHNGNDIIKMPKQVLGHEAASDGNNIYTDAIFGYDDLGLVKISKTGEVATLFEKAVYPKLIEKNLYLFANTAEHIGILRMNLRSEKIDKVIPASFMEVTKMFEFEIFDKESKIAFRDKEHVIFFDIDLLKGSYFFDIDEKLQINAALIEDKISYLNDQGFNKKGEPIDIATEAAVEEAATEKFTTEQDSQSEVSVAQEKHPERIELTEEQQKAVNEIGRLENEDIKIKAKLNEELKSYICSEKIVIKNILPGYHMSKNKFTDEVIFLNRNPEWPVLLLNNLVKIQPD